MKNIKLKFIVFFGALFLIASLFQLNDYYEQKLIQIELDSSLKDLKTNYDVVRFNYQANAESIFHRLMSDERIVKILDRSLNAKDKKLDDLRNQLEQLISIEYKSSQKLGLNLIVFIHPNNTVFYRAHKKEKYGDDIGAIRKSIVQVNKTHQQLSTFESGKMIHACRNIYPIFNKDKKYLGCVDIGFSSEYLQNTLEEVHKLHTHFLINRHTSSIQIWNRDNFYQNYKVSMEDDDYLVSIRTNVVHDFKELSKKTIKQHEDLIHINMDEAKEFSIYGIDEDMSIIISFSPIFTLDNYKIPSAYIVSYVKNQQIPRIIENAFYVKIGIFIVLIMLMYQIYLVLSKKHELEMEVKRKTKELKDINDNLEKKVQSAVEKNLQHEIKIHEQAKLAALGDMIGNIVHQWRQPLSNISTLSSVMIFKNQIGTLDKNEIDNELHKILFKTKYLSETIDTFRNYLKEKKEKKIVVLQDRLDVALSITKPVIEDNFIELYNKVDYSKKIEIDVVIGELVQVLINIINNAKDILIEKQIENPWITIESNLQDDKVLLSIEDNGGGIPDEVFPRIFEQYFTTKDSAIGTGLGLHMSYQIITESLNGKLSVENTQNGAKFIITLPCKII